MTGDYLNLENAETLRDNLAKVVGGFWIQNNSKRLRWLNSSSKVRAYLSAETTRDTEVGSATPWKNSTTIPKLTQIADNLHAYYKAALFPDGWLKFEGANAEAESKARVIEEYMNAKLQAMDFDAIADRWLRDWITYGNCWGSVTWLDERVEDPLTGEEIIKFVGAKPVRVSPNSSMMNPKAIDFDKSWFIRRELTHVTEIAENKRYNSTARSKVLELRSMNADVIDWYINEGLRIDGFDTFDHYLQDGYVEVLEFWGDVFLPWTREVKRNRHIVIADRCFVLLDEEIPAWTRTKPVAWSGWRVQPDNLYASGPLQQLAGMQYRCDHLENLKADAFDQIIHPIIKIKGDTVDEFEFGPGIQIRCGEGDVEFLRPDSSVLQCDNQVAYYHQMMEMMAGSPKESMGFRTPGEKTAFEVDVLQQGADRMFIDKVQHFEKFLERILNIMLEMTIRNLNVEDVIRVFNDQEKTTRFMTVTREDITARGYIKPKGSSHYQARNKRMRELQNALQLLPSVPSSINHISGLRFAQMLEDELGWEKYGIVEENVAIKEAAASEMEAAVAQQMAGGMGIDEGEDTAGAAIPEAPL